MKTNQQTEVLVVGSGPVGMFTALLLGRNGVQTQIIDQEQRTAARSYTCVLHPRSVHLLDQAGLARDAFELGWPVRKIRFYDGKNQCAEATLFDSSSNYPILIMPPTGLEDLLEKELKKLSNVHFGWKQRLRELQNDDKEVTMTVEQLAYVGKGYVNPEFELAVEKEGTVQCGYVVGADGGSSIVRKRLGIPSEPLGVAGLFDIYEFETDATLPHEMAVVMDHHGIASVMWPFGPHRCCCIFRVAEEVPGKARNAVIGDLPVSLEESRCQLQQFLEERAPWFKGSFNEPVFMSTRYDHRMAAQFGRGRCWLAGDAAHQSSRAAMHSLNFGLNEAADLAGTLVKILRDNGPSSLLDDYNQLHRHEWEKLFKSRPQPDGTASTWAVANSARILDCLPVSGQELTEVLRQLGLKIS